MAGPSSTIPGKDGCRAGDLVNREFTATAPNQLWVADFTYVRTWAGFTYVAFIVDVFSRMIVGWKADTTMRADLVTDTLDMAAWARGRAGVTDLTGLIHHTDAGSQYVSLALTERLAALGMRASIGTVGDAYDNALAESTIGLFKTELIRRRGPWRTLDDVEIATLEWVDWCVGNGCAAARSSWARRGAAWGQVRGHRGGWRAGPGALSQVRGLGDDESLPGGPGRLSRKPVFAGSNSSGGRI